MKNKVLIYSLLIIAITFGVYSNSFTNQFLWDDEFDIIRNTDIHDWHHLKDIFTKNAVHGSRKGSNFYRPLRSITYAVDYSLWNLNPLGYHISNTLFHALCAFLIFLIFRQIFSIDVAFLTALFFAIHPIHTEAVTYISGRADPLSGVFIFLTLFLFAKFRKTNSRHFYILSSVSFVAAVLSKEYAAISPFLLLTYLYFFDQIKKRDVKILLPFFIIAGIYVALRLTLLDFTHTIPEHTPKPFYYLPFYVRLSTFLKTIPVYFGLLLWPIDLHMERSVELATSIFEPQSFLGAVLLAALFTVGFLFRRKNKLILFSIAWFTIAIFPNSNLIPINDLIYEHWLYLPSLGFFIMLSHSIASYIARRNRMVSIFLFCIIFIFYAGRTMFRNRDWHDPITLYEKTIPYKPDSARLHNNLAMAYSDAGRLDDAIREYKKAIEVGDYYAETHYNLADAYFVKGNFSEGMKELRRSLEIEEGFIYSHEKLAVIYFQERRFTQAKKESEKILELEPQNKIALEILKRLHGTKK